MIVSIYINRITLIVALLIISKLVYVTKSFDRLTNWILAFDVSISATTVPFSSWAKLYGEKGGIVLLVNVNFDPFIILPLYNNPIPNVEVNVFATMPRRE